MPEKDEWLDRCYADDPINAAWLDMQCGPEEDDGPCCAGCGKQSDALQNDLCPRCYECQGGVKLRGQ